MAIYYSLAAQRQERREQGSQAKKKKQRRATRHRRRHLWGWLSMSPQYKLGPFLPLSNLCIVATCLIPEPFNFWDAM